MKVYARYFEEDGLDFRRDTILQFGDCWNVIGSIILINPGSASPTSDTIAPHIIDELLKLTDTTDKDSWKEFSVDPTMYQIEKLFNGYYIGKNRKLNGVIQLFNLFNLRNANLSQALELFKTTSNLNIISIEQDITRIGNKPVYIGWGNTGKKTLKNIAEKVFYSLPQQSYLLKNFADNPFYHPRYLQFGYKKREKVIKLLHNFYNQNQDYVWDAVAMDAIKLNSKVICEYFNNNITKIINNKKEIEIDIEGKTTRVFFKDLEQNTMEFIVTQIDKGYTAIRYKKGSHIVKDNSDDYIALGDKTGLNPTDDYLNGNWLLRNSLKSFGNNEQKVAKELIKSLQQFLSMT